MVRLNEKQRAVAEENLGIVYWTVRRFRGWEGYSLHEHDLISAGQYALVMALAGDSYREEMGVTFPGWLSMSISRAVYKQVRRYKAPAGTYYAPHRAGQRLEPYPPEPAVDHRRVDADAVDDADAVEKLLSHVSPRDASHLRRTAEGWSHPELAREEGVTKQAIQMRCKKAIGVIRSTPTYRQLVD